MEEEAAVVVVAARHCHRRIPHHLNCLPRRCKAWTRQHSMTETLISVSILNRMGAAVAVVEQATRIHREVATLEVMAAAAAAEGGKSRAKQSKTE